MRVIPESLLAHKWLDGLRGLEIGPSTHNPFGLNTRNVGLRDEIYHQEQVTLVGEAASLDILAEGDAIPVPSESEDFVLSSHVIEHCPNFLNTVLEWYRIIKPGGLLYIIVPHPDSAPGDRGKPLTDWEHVVQDYVLNTSAETEPEAGEFLHCHYHIFSPATMKAFFLQFFGERLTLVDAQKNDDKIGNGFALVYRKQGSLIHGYPWSLDYQGKTVCIPKPADFYLLKESVQRSSVVSPKVEVIVPAQPDIAPSSQGSILPKSKTGSPRVSVIVAAYNAERFMRGALEDLEEQTIAHEIEIIIVETGSQTEEYKIITEFQARYSNIIYVRTSKRENPAAACNRGIQMARGKYITLAPTDDRRRVDALEVLASELDTHQDVALVYGDVFVTNFENQRFASHIRCGYHLRPEFSPEIMLSGCHMGPQAMWRKSIHDGVGYFDETLLSATDYEFWCRIAERYPMKHIPALLGVYYENPEGVINSNQERAQQETREVQQAFRSKFPAPKGPYTNNFQYQGRVQNEKFVNIGMVTFNRLEFTKAALTALIQNTCFPHVITVVDNGSTDGTPEYLQALHRQGFITNLILLPNNVGIAKASNLAWAQAPHADYYLKLDNDIVIQKPGWLSKMVEVIDRFPEFGAVAYNFEPMSYPVKEIGEVPIRPKDGNLGGACILIPRRTHQVLGFWCEDYGLYGEEDADYGFRIQLHGLQNAYMADEQVGTHLPAGRAAHIDAHTLKATDGVEENTHAAYRAFKDECRQKNVRQIANKNFQEYQLGRRSLYCASPFVLEYKKGLAVSQLADIPIAGKIQGVKSPTGVSAGHPNSSTGEKDQTISVILSDSICGRIRLIQPLLAGEGRWKIGSITCDGTMVTNGSPPPAGTGQIWVIQRTCMMDVPYLANVQARGTRLVHDCDDLLWEIPPDNPNHRVFTPDLVGKIFQLMEMADCVTVSTEPIKADLEKRGIAATVISNSLIRGEWESFKPQRRAGSRPRIGWAGQAKVHKSDIAILAKIIEALKDEVEWVLLGDVPQAAMSPGVLSESVSMVDLTDYPKKLANLNLDLALAPLVPNRFNEAKSDIRILQYGILGYPVIGTDIYPHQHAPIQRVPHDPKYWIQAIRERIHDLDALDREGENLRQWVLTNRLFEHALPKYEQAWLGRIPRRVDNGTNSKEHHTSTPAYSPKTQKCPAFDCSIIIPVFNKVELTRQCLTTLAEATDGCSYEVIVVDNASSDGTKEFLRTLGGDITIISNPENYGFAKACNQGAAAAKGRYLVFLNNDTIPKIGWLRALMDEVECHQDVAIVGSKLLYPDDTIQHAGVVFSKNCLTPYHVFRGAPGNLKAVNMRREFQVVTAACMLIRHEEFNGVGGFDEIFKNGFEDVDLCLKVGRRGKKIIYQPQSVLYHLEHQTPGRKDLESERHNGKVLMERWGSSILVDEDLYTVPEGYANHYYFRDGWLRQLLEPFRDEAERAQWEKVRTVQELLLRKQKEPDKVNKVDESILRTLMTEVIQWPQDIEVLRWGASVCRSINLVELELKFWERILLLGENIEAREFLAKSLLTQGNVEEASCHIRIILSQNVDHPMGNFLNGIWHIQKQQYAEAVQFLQKALASGADRNKTQRGLGMAYEGLGRLDQAWKVLNNVREHCPDDSEIMKHLLQTGTALERWEELGNILTTYLERNPADCDMRFALAGVQLRAGKISQAQYHYSILATLKPDYEGLQDLQSMLDQPGCLSYASAK